MGFSLALSGGGLLGAAHIGVLKALENAGLRPVALAGTSAGGLVAGLYALGVTSSDLEAAGALITAHPERYFHINGELFAELWPWNPTRATGLINPSQFLSELLNLAPLASTTEDFLVPTVVTSVDLVSMRAIAFTNIPRVVPLRGRWEVYHRVPLNLALGATMALPGLFDAPRWNNRVLVDGGTADTLPVDWAKALFHGPVVAVNVAVPPAVNANQVGIEEILSRSEDYATQTLSELRASDANVFSIAPMTQHVPFFGFNDYAMLIDHGYQAVQRVLPQLKQFIDSRQ